MARKNLKVPEELFYSLRDAKPDSQSWPEYLEAQCLGEDSDSEVIERLERLENLVQHVPERTADEVDGRVRR